MKSSTTTILVGGFLALSLTLGTTGVRAQDEPDSSNPGNPKPAARSTPIPPLDNGEDTIQDLSGQMQPDTTPLTGIVNSTLGTSELRHSYWVPGIQYASNVQSGQYGQGGGGWFVNNYILGNLSLLKAWSHSQLAVNYSGGGVFSTNSQEGNSWSQQFALSQTFQWNRWQLMFLDQFSYLPQSQFGFGAGTGLGIPGVGGSTGPTVPGIGAGVIPNQSILSAIGPRYSNTAVIQVTYQLTPRGSITASGTYGILRFVDPGNVDSNEISGSLGYNYQLTRADTIGLVYRYSNFQYPGEPQAFGDQVVSVAYGRKITGRLAFQATGGPEYSTFRVPINNQTSKLGVNATVNLTYAFENGGVSAGYIHGLSGGSGVFLGSTVDQVNLGVNRRLGRVWAAQANFGFAHNIAVASEFGSAASYNSILFGAGINRPFGRNMNLSLAYSANINTSSQSSGCSGSSCSGSQTVNYITLSFQWHTQPLVLP